MSLNVSGYNISDIYVGDDKIDSIFVGEDLVYSSVPPVDYFYFEIDDPTLTAEVGFSETKRANESGDGEQTYVSEWDTYFQTYSPLELFYSFDASNWIQYSLGDPINIGAGYSSDKVYFRGINNAPSFEFTTTTLIEEGKTYQLMKYTSAFINSQDSACVSAGGDVRSLRHYDDINLNSPPCVRAYTNLFKKCALLSHPPKLLYTTMTSECYAGMFSQCTSLAEAPELPATTLAERCYGAPYTTVFSTFDPTTSYLFIVDGMFSQCTSLAEAPELPATTLAAYCYHQMFTVCTSLASAPVLPATTLASHCYYMMFKGCTSLTTPPVLPATTLVEWCYGGMFGVCTSLASAPVLPATTLAVNCYNTMFEWCTSLTTPPVLPATTLASHCYYMMFGECTSLTTPPALPATTLAKSCYSYMFYGCTGLTRIPILPVLSIPDNAYEYMYHGSSVRGNAQSSGVCNKAYRIPSAGNGTAGSKAFDGMFENISGLESDTNYTPSVNTTFYINVPSF